MTQSEHRTDATGFNAIQAGNREWWTRNTMSYDWKDRVRAEKCTLPWFDEIDRRFVRDSRLFAHDKEPFDRLIPFADLKGKRVLEIGCGMGYHTELMVQAGAEVSAIDVSETSVQSTTTRLSLKGLTAAVTVDDAEAIPFPDGTFDFVWSWGVIHHSSRTALIVREIARVLRPNGACRIMVYNRDSGSAWISLFKYHWLRLGFLRGHTPDQSLNAASDGYQARHYTKDQFEDLFRAFFREVHCAVIGQEVDALLLPRRTRSVARRFVSDSWLKKKQARRGAFLFLTAHSPF